MTCKLSGYEHLTRKSKALRVCVYSPLQTGIRTPSQDKPNVEQREERAEVPVCLVLQADGGEGRGNGTPVFAT